MATVKDKGSTDPEVGVTTHNVITGLVTPEPDKTTTPGADSATTRNPVSPVLQEYFELILGEWKPYASLIAVTGFTTLAEVLYVGKLPIESMASIIMMDEAIPETSIKAFVEMHLFSDFLLSIQQQPLDESFTMATCRHYHDDYRWRTTRLGQAPLLRNRIDDMIVTLDDADIRRADGIPQSVSISANRSTRSRGTPRSTASTRSHRSRTSLADRSARSRPSRATHSNRLSLSSRPTRGTGSHKSGYASTTSGLTTVGAGTKLKFQTEHQQKQIDPYLLATVRKIVAEDRENRTSAGASFLRRSRDLESVQSGMSGSTMSPSEVYNKANVSPEAIARAVTLLQSPEHAEAIANGDPSDGLTTTLIPTRVSTRYPLSAKVKWGGQNTTFPIFHNIIKAWFTTNRLEYMLNPRFLSTYKTGGWTQARSLAPNTTSQQFEYDRHVIFGSLQSACREGAGRVFFMRHGADLDGVSVWIEFLDEYNKDSNIDAKLHVLEVQTSIQWHDSFPGGVHAYLDTLEAGFLGMDEADPDNKFHAQDLDRTKMRRVTFALRGTQIYSKYADAAYKDYQESGTFREFVAYIKREVDVDDIQAGSRANRQAHVVTQEGKDDIQHALTQLFRVTTEQGDKDTGYYSLASSNGNPNEAEYEFRQFLNATQDPDRPRRKFTDKSFAIGFKAFQLLKTLDPDILTRFIEAREKVQQEALDGATTPFSRKEEPPPTSSQTVPTSPALPKQYGAAETRANLATKQPSDDFNDDESSDDSLDQLDTISQTMNAFAIMQDIVSSPVTRRANVFQVRCHLEWTREARMNIALRAIDGWYHTISDSGADTFMFGAGWQCVGVPTGRPKVNIIGFDPVTARKNGCRIEDGATVVRDKDGNDVLLYVYEGVRNGDSEQTLLSEFQVRENGVIVDSVSKRHKGVDGQPGTQSIIFPTDHQPLVVPLNNVGALMTFQHRLPTEHEFEGPQALPRYYLTQRGLWDPTKYYDQGELIEPLSTPASLAYVATRDLPPGGVTGADDGDVLDSVLVADQAALMDIPTLLPRDDDSRSADADENDEWIDTASEPETANPTFLFVLDTATPPISDTIAPSATAPLGIPAIITHSPSASASITDSLTGSVSLPAANEEPAAVIGPALTAMIAVTTSENDAVFQDAREPPDLEFLDAQSYDHWHPAPAEPVFLDACATDHDLEPYFWDPSDKIDDKARFGRAFHLTFDQSVFLRMDALDDWIEEFDDQELTGFNLPFDTYAYAARTVAATNHDAAKAQGYLGFRPLEVIRRTLENTTQLAMLTETNQMRRHVKSLYPFLNRPRLAETVATDTFFASVRGVSGATCAQVFYGLSSHMINVYPMQKESQGPERLDDFGREEGIPAVMRSDNSKMQRWGKSWVKRLREWLTGAEFTEPHHPQQNPAELRAVRWLKQGIATLRRRTGAPSMLWAYAAKYLAQIHNLTADETLDWITPFQKRRGHTPDISAYLQFQFYERVFYLDCSESFPSTKEKAGYWLGVAENVGDALTYHILTDDTEQVIERSVVRSAKKKPNKTVRFDDALNPDLDEEEDGHELDDAQDLLLGNEKVSIDPKVATVRRTRISSKKQLRRAERRNQNQPQRTGLRSQDIGSPVMDTLIAPATDDTDDDSIEEPDSLSINSVPVLSATDGRKLRDAPKAANQQAPPTIRRTLRNRTKPARLNFLAKTIVRTAFAIPLTMALISTQVVEPMHGNQCTSATLPGALLLDEVVSKPSYNLPCMTRDETDLLEYGRIMDAYNDRDDPDNAWWSPSLILKHKVVHRRERECLVKVKWMNDGASWVPLGAVRLDNPFVLLDYAARHKLEHHPDWKWTTEYTAERRVQLARAFKAQVDPKAPQFKFGVEVPQHVGHAMRLDRTNMDTLWRESIEKELQQINDYKTFRSLAKGEDLSTFTKIPYHIVFDVKFDLRRKARLVAGGNHTTPPKEDIYSGVVGMDTIRLGFQIAAMNDLMVCAADIGNAFLYGKTRERVYVKAGKEFGDLAGTPMIIDRGLYGLRSSAARFHEHLSTKLRLMGYRPSKADPDFWLKDKGTHYEYLATFVDDVLAFGKDPLATINELKKDYVLKGIGAPEYYLGGDVIDLDGTWRAEGINTGLSARTYVKNVVEKFEKVFNADLREFKSPMEASYHPECDDSPFCDSRSASIYRGLIGSANWMITLGRFDIHYATNTMARYSMAPREGHLTAMKRVFGYLKKFPHGQILVDPSYPDHSKYKSEAFDWTEFYPDAEEELPPDMPEPKGKPARMTCSVDADHAHDVVTRRSVTGIILLVNNMPTAWISKRQKTVETSTYGSELVAARIAVDLIVEMRYKLRMLGVPIDGPALMLGDNMSVVLNTTIPSSQLKKKHNAISYHRVREAIAGKILRFAHIPSKLNSADFLTKPLPSDQFLALVQPLLFRQPRSRLQQEGPSTPP